MYGISFKAVQGTVVCRDKKRVEADGNALWSADAADIQALAALSDAAATYC